MHLLHKWKYVNKYKYTFLGVEYEGDSSDLRVCTKCEKAQEFSDDSGGGMWRWLNRQEQKIFDDKLRKGEIK